MEKKIECKIVQDLLLGYADNVLNEESKKLVESHLLDCDNCKQKLNDIKKDILEHNDTQSKQIDYLKKVRRKSILKAFRISLILIFLLFALVFIHKFIIINTVAHNFETSLQLGNIYEEDRQELDDEVSIIKTYFKDGRYKRIYEIYSDDGMEQVFTEYASDDSNKLIQIIEKNKEIKVYDKTTKLSTISSIPTPFIANTNLLEKLITSFTMSVHTSKNYDGTECYVLQNQFDKSNKWELWLDKQTGLLIKEVIKDSSIEYFAGTNVVKNIKDNIQEHKYQLNTVTDEDVKLPDFSDYEIKTFNN